MTSYYPYGEYVWDNMRPSNRVAFIMNVFPRRLWHVLISEPLFSPEDLHEIFSYCTFRAPMLPTYPVPPRPEAKSE